ncbi:glycine cleavage H-protein [mine drainage metagenome]|uniref:Glycine cleavage H-protein n=1 Tax=mine drainage metagenome TaxID=410659 RepID=T0ZDA1_9ZZZZ
MATVNEAMVATPAIANEDPYEKGWLLVIKPLDWGTVRPTLVAGVDVAGPYEAKMTADGFAGCGG